ncbi:hypothetical protein ACFL3T_04505 [Patescibacteria group bacterium]
MDITVIIILAVIGLAILLAFFVMIKSSRKGLTETQQKYVRKHWNQIVDEVGSNPNLAIMEADKLLGYTLKAKGIEGSVGEQLKSTPSTFSDLNGIWTAHKLRNQIAHEIGMKISSDKAKSNLSIFKKALNDLGAKL